jgi:uncharacterized membrane protein YphA (DoxX/SURF4 family)
MYYVPIAATRGAMKRPLKFQSYGQTVDSHSLIDFLVCHVSDLYYAARLRGRIDQPGRNVAMLSRQWFFDSHAPSAVLLIRLLVGWVFLSEGIQKFLYPASLGVGRFEKIGIPFPAFFGPFVGSVEIICGTLLIIGLFTRMATIPLIIDISVAILTTKIPMLAKSGFWAMMHEARTDYCVLLGLVFLLLSGAGRLSLDARIDHAGEQFG